ncbi:MAG: lysophospholipid acyltransferase family protein [Lentisphaerae bacterium]|nr:lysophospholipid acyltransferase family protein [Lentisphaerota bacterium]MCP4100228.1 lysophospholipid acyltransferase family protein [Lentisphaerota bacterium]
MSLKKTNKQKHKKKHKLLVIVEFVPFWCLYMFVRALPLKAAYFLTRRLFSLLYLVDFRHRRRSQRHLIHAGVAKDKKEAWRIAHRAFLSFGMLLTEIIKMDQYFKPEKVVFRGSEESRKEAFESENNRNVIVVTAHYGNWELAGTAWAKLSKIPMVSVMRPFNNPLIGRYILRNRTSGVHETVNKRGCVRDLLKALRNNKNVALLVDQHAGTNEGVETLFFGQPCRTHMSPALLHLKTKVPIVPMISRRVDDDFNFEFVLGKPIEYTPTGDKEEDIKNVTQLYTSALEKLIAELPEQWLWAHRRWLNIHRKRRTPATA